MSYDVRMSARKREKKQSNEQNQDNEYDVRKSARSREANAIAEGLSTQINDWLGESEKYVHAYNSRFVDRSENKYVSDSKQWWLNAMARKNSLDKERDNILSTIEKYEPYMNAEWVRTVKSVLDNSGTTQKSILNIAKEDVDFWNKFPDENAYNSWQQDNANALKYGTMTGEELKEAEENSPENVREREYDAELQHLREMYDRIYKSDDVNPYALETWYTDYSTSAPETRTDPETDAKNLALYNELRGEFESFGAIADRIAELKGKKRALNKSVAYTLSDGTEITWADLYEDAYRRKYHGKTYDQLNELLAAMEDGEEKKWLTDYAPSVMTAQDYDKEIADADTNLQSMQAELRQLVQKGSVDSFTPEEIERAHYLQDEIKKLSQKKNQFENERKYNFLYQNEDFTEKSGYVSTGATDKWTVALSQYNLGDTDVLYEYINNQDGLQDRISHKHLYEAYGNLTDKEKATYNYLYTTEGKESAEEYLKYLKPELNARNQDKTRRQAAVFATENPNLANLASVGATLVSGVGVLDALVQKIENDIKGDYYKPIDMNTDAMTPSITSSTIRRVRAQNLADKYGTIQIDEEDHPILSRLFNGKSLGDVYQLGMSMVDSTATALLSPVLGPASTLLLAGNSATQIMLSAAENGASDEQALWMGALSGAFEFLFEKYELESLLKNGSENAVRAFVSQSLSEGFGEGMTTISNLVADTLIMADKSELNRTIEAYREQHPDWSEEKLRKEALKDLAIQTGWDVIGGTVSGGIMGGGYSAINKGIDKLHSLAQEKVDAEQQALQQLANEMNGVENSDLPVKTNPMSIKEQLRNSQDTLNQMKPVAEIQIPKHFSELDIAGKINWVVEKLRPTGYKVERKELGTIKFGRKQLKGAFNYFDKGSVEEAAFEALPYVLENGVEISEHINHKDREYGTVTIAAPVTIDGQRGNMAVVVKKTTENFYKVHRILTPDGAVFELSATENEAELTPAGESPKTGSLATPISSASINSISQSMPGVNDEISSLQGKTILLSENREVSVKKFTGFADGTATVKLADGTEAAEKDVAFADDAENVLFHFIAREDGMTASAANAIWSLWQANKQSTAPIPAAAFRNSAFAVWRAGVRGDSRILNDNDSSASALTAQQKEIIYEAGRKAAQDSTDAAQKNIDAVYEQAETVLQQKGKTGSRTYRAVTATGVYVKDMSPTQKASFLLAQKIAAAVKVDIEVYNGGKEFGYYNPRKDKICLNINAKWNSRTMMAFTLAHELLHRTKHGSPAQYKAFADFLVKEFGKQGSDIEAMVAEQLKAADEFDKTVPENQRIHMTEDMAFEEVVADACQRMLLETDAGKRLAEFGAQSEQKRNFLKRFARWLRELLENLRSVFQDVPSDSLAANEFMRFEENVKQTLADMFVKMNIDAGEKLSTIKEAGLTEKITTETGGVKYKLSYDEAIQRLDDGTLNRNDNTHLKLLDKTPELYIKKAGAKDLKIIMAWDVAFLAMRKNGDISGNYHGLGKEIMLRIPAAIENPLYIIKQNNGRIAAITEIVVKGKKPVLVSIELDAYKATKQDGTFEDDNYNLIVTVMDAQPNYLKNTVFSGDVVYNKNNEAPAHFILRLKSLNKALPNDDRTRASSDRSTPTSERSALIAEGYGKIASKDSIRNSEQNVNENFEELVGSHKKIPVKEYAADREMLVDIFEQMVTNSTEYKVLQDYKSHMYEMSALEAAVESLSAEIGRLSFAEGPRDMEYINNLKLQKKQAINRLNYYDNKLLGLEKSGVLKAMIERNRQKVTQESFDRARKRNQRRENELREYYRERNQRRENEIREYYRESHRKAVERHRTSEMKQKFRRIVKQLHSLQETKTRDKRTKDELREFVDSALKAADMVWLEKYDEYDMVRNGVGIQLRGNEEQLFQECRELLEKHMDIPEAENKWDIEGALQAAKDKAALDKELAKKMKQLRDAGIFAEEYKRRNGMNTEQLLDDLISSYQKLQGTQSQYLHGAYQKVVSDNLEQVKKKVGTKPVRNLTAEEVEVLCEAYESVLYVVQTANQTFATERAMKISELGAAIAKQLKVFGTSRIGRQFREKLKQMTWENLTPAYVFRLTGSKQFGELYQNLVEGSAVTSRDIAEAEDFWKEHCLKYKANRWDMNERETFVDREGTEFSLSLGQMLSIYALSKRKQAVGHLTTGGIKLDTSEKYIENTLDKLLPKQITDATAYRLNQEILDAIGKKLTEEQRSFVDATQKYLSEVMGEKGNGVSMKLYGIKLFTEKFYFPLRVSSQERYVSTELIDQRKLKNSGFTQEVDPNANNPVIISDYSHVWTGHIKQMSLYHGITLPMEDMDRVLNYGKTAQTDAQGNVLKDEAGNVLETDGVDSLSVVLQNVWGKHPENYIRTMMQQANGGIYTPEAEKLSTKLLARFKKTAVLWNLSVWIQQWTSVFRSMAHINFRYFVQKPILGKSRTAELNDMKKHCPIVYTKLNTGFDTGTSNSLYDSFMMLDLRDVVKEQGVIQAVKEFWKHPIKRFDDMGGVMSNRADVNTMLKIWRAAKRETVSEHPELKIGSEEFYKTASKRFTEVVTLTQVYDSTFTKSAKMRENTFLAKALTSFMAEPTLTLNMLIDAKLQKDRTGKAPVGTYVAVFVSITANALCKALIYAMRDDEEEETFLEKYTSAFTSSMLDGINPLTYIPFIRDLWSTAQGYTVARDDTEAWSQVINSVGNVIKKMTDEDATEQEEAKAWISLLESFAEAVGIPAKNIHRDIKAIANMIGMIDQDLISNTRDTTANSLKDATQEALWESIPILSWVMKEENKADKLLDAHIAGDESYAERLRDTYNTEADANTAIVKEIKKRFRKGKLTENEAIDYLKNYAGKENNKAVQYIDEWKFKLEYPNVELTQGQVQVWNKFAAPAGISLENYETYVDAKGGLKNKSEIVPVIHALPLTRKQKDALYLAEGYAESKLDEAPWNQ